jgi:ubiquitin carboxyl-terminal hydrolase 7
MKNLYDSFKDYVAVEMLDGENKYQAEGLGLQDAKKGIIFESFPPVLHLQLKRFEYDIQRDAMVKINDRHEFPFEIDLDEFLDASADRSQPWLYKLHGVLVHSGDLHGGHYFALIKPDRETRWLKFDDDRVTPVTDKEVLEENYGGEILNGIPQTLQRNQVRAMKRFTNAYMLVYIRETAINEVLPTFAADDTPPHLSAFIQHFPEAQSLTLFLRIFLERRLDEERLQIEAKKKEREEQHLFLTAKVCAESSPVTAIYDLLLGHHR